MRSTGKFEQVTYPSPISKALVIEAISIIRTNVGFFVLGNITQLELMSMSSNIMSSNVEGFVYCLCSYIKSKGIRSQT